MEVKPWALGGGGWGEGCAGRVGRAEEPTYLVEELRQLHLDLLALEHVVLCLLADGRDQVELPGHRVGLLWMQGGAWWSLTVSRSGGTAAQQGGDTEASPRRVAHLPRPLLTAFLGAC